MTLEGDDVVQAEAACLDLNLILGKGEGEPGGEMTCSIQRSKEGSLPNVSPGKISGEDKKWKQKKERELDSKILEEMLPVL